MVELPLVPGGNGAVRSAQEAVAGRVSRRGRTLLTL